MGGWWMSRLLVAEDKWRHIGIAPLGDRGAAEGRLVVAWTPSSLRPGGCDCSTAQTRGSGGPGRVQGAWGGRRGFHRPPAIHAGERKWTGGFCGPVTAWTLGQTLSTSFLSHLHPHLLPAGRRQAPACRKPSETGGPGGGPGKAPPGGKTRLHLGKREGQVLSQLALVRTSM